ncbi:MAG: acyl-CoA desaturase [Bacteroidetes bacterium]|nr:acyl-CoA desaturase [Bacteroidota bacterium]
MKKMVKFVDPNKRMFFNTLKARVDDYFHQNKVSPYGNFQMVLKTLLLFTLYLLPFMLMLTLPMSMVMQLGMWILMGIGLAGIGMNVMHDAIHGAYSPREWVNRTMGYSLNFLGASVYNWRFQHNVLHHTYTNVTYLDDDIADKVVLKFSPHTEVRKIHRFQWIYAFFFYGISTLYWVFAKDFMQFYRYQLNGVNQNAPEVNRKALVRMILVKVAYMVIILGLPLFVLGTSQWLSVVLGFILMHFVAGVVLSVVFQLAHTVEEASHPMPNDQGCIENEWAIHQLNTTVNFSRNNKLLSWYVGGLNFQVEHHLFPRVCHIHYPKIAPIVKQTAEEFGIPYLENPNFSAALRSHLSALRRFGKMPDLNEAIG